jgi:hypothetical protein
MEDVSSASLARRMISDQPRVPSLHSSISIVLETIRTVGKRKRYHKPLKTEPMPPRQQQCRLWATHGRLKSFCCLWAQVCEASGLRRTNPCTTQAKELGKKFPVHVVTRNKYRHFPFQYRSKSTVKTKGRSGPVPRTKGLSRAPPSCSQISHLLAAPIFTLDGIV